MAAKVLSIEIGSSRTRVVEMDFKANAAKIYHYFSFETPQGMVNDGVIKANEGFRRILKEKLHERKIRTTKVVFSINSGRIANREVTIPMVKENKIQTLLMANSSEYFPVDLAEYQLVYRISDRIETQNSRQFKLLVFAVPIEIIRSYQELANFCGLSIRAIDYVGNSIYQEMKQMSGQEQSVILKVDENSSMITIVQEGKVRLQRSMPYGIGSGISGDKEIFSEETAGELRYLIGNVSRVIDYYTSQNKENPITGIWLAGVGAEYHGLEEILSSEWNMKVEVLQELPGISIGKEAEEGFKSAGYIACTGAVLDPLPFRFSEEGEKKASSEDSFKIPLIVAGSCVVLSLALVLGGTIHYMGLGAKGRRLEERIEELQPAKQVYNTYNQVTQQYREVQTMQEMTKTPNDALLTLLEEMEGNMPSDMKVTGMSANAEGVTMSITTGDKESAAKVIMELREFTTLDNVAASAVTEEKDETGVTKVSFTVICTYRSVEGNAKEVSADGSNSEE